MSCNSWLSLGDIPWDGYTFIGDEVIFTDDLFNGQSKTITLDVQSDFKFAEFMFKYIKK